VDVYFYNYWIINLEILNYKQVNRIIINLKTKELMAFQNSPRLEGNTKWQGGHIFINWISKYSRSMLLIIGLFFCLLISFSLVLILDDQLSKPGGLDGCIVNAQYEPISATLQIKTLTKSTYEDGCFFFPNLEPGTHQLIITTKYGQVLELPVKIISGQATNLGDNILVP
jgi:hypothetical protein